MWDGAAGQIMLSLDAWYAKVSRLTFDGKSKASIGLYRGDTFSTGCELSDLQFKDMGIGVQFGGGLAGADGGQAEHAVLRCQFLRMTTAGVVTENYNSLDIWVWYNRFEDCQVGVQNHSGNFHVYKSLFLRSKDADIASENLLEFSFVGNTSVGSKTFTNWQIGQTWGAPILIQGNYIYDTQDNYAIVTGTGGPFVVIDNVIRNRDGYTGPSVSATANDQVLVGNTYTGTDAINVDNGRGNVRVRNLDAHLVARQDVPPPDMTLPPTPPNLHRKIFEVDRGAADVAAAFQAQIDAAAMEPAGSFPVVHLAKGDYQLNRTVVVPAGKAIQIIGDGGGDNGSHLSGGGGTGPVLQLEGPSRAVLRDFGINGGQGDGLLLTNADQPGGRVYGHQLYALADPSNPAAYGIFVNGVENSDVTLPSVGLTGSERNVLVKGGPSRSTGAAAPGQVSILNGSSCCAGIFYDVSDGGELLVEAVWYEGNWPDATHINLTSSGSLTLTGLQLAVPKDTPPLMGIHGFRGTFTILTSGFVGYTGTGKSLRLDIDGDGTNTKVLAMGDMFWVNDMTSPAVISDVWRDTSSPPAQADLFSCNQNGNLTGAFATLPNVTANTTDMAPSDTAILDGLKLLRAARIEPPNHRAAGVTDVKMFRIFSTAGAGKTCVEIRR
jgi:hypothetical protein